MEKADDLRHDRRKLQNEKKYPFVFFSEIHRHFLISCIARRRKVQSCSFSMTIDAKKARDHGGSPGPSPFAPTTIFNPDYASTPIMSDTRPLPSGWIQVRTSLPFVPDKSKSEQAAKTRLLTPDALHSTPLRSN
jgi:hypothetical protein